MPRQRALRPAAQALRGRAAALAGTIVAHAEVSLQSSADAIDYGADAVFKGTVIRPDSTAEALTGAARAVQAADPLWDDVTTFARPTLEYATASRELFHVLEDITATLQPSSQVGLDTSRALPDLVQANTTIADLMAATRTLPERLARAQLLHIPRGRMTVVELNSHRRLPTKPATVYEVEDLVRAWDAAGTSARDAVSQLNHELGTRLDHPLRALAPIERTL